MNIEKIKQAMGEIKGSNFGECQCHYETMVTAYEALQNELKGIEGCDFCKSGKKNCNNCTHGAGSLCHKEYCENWNLHEFDNFCKYCGKDLKMKKSEIIGNIHDKD